MRFVLALSALLAFIPLRVVAWSGAGHELIAAIAWREFPADTKAKVFELLKSHPDFAKWEASFEGASGNVDLPAFVFMRASRWPDEIRRRGNKYDHPHWHYVDWELKPPSFPMTEEPAPTDNVIFGLAQSGKVLADTNAPAEERAASLSWIIHLCGDIAQPLHCCSLFTDAYPSGDKGGNDFWVKPATRGVKLHALWDGLLGTSGKPQTHFNDAIRIAAVHPRQILSELQRHRTAKEWSLEGRGLAVQRVYLAGKLQGSTTADAAPSLPDGYTKEAKAVAERQAAKAGYRLADEIRNFL